MEFKFIGAADVHLDSPMNGLVRYENVPVDEMRDATRKAFVKLVNLAITEEVAFVLITGDLFNGDWKDYNSGLFLTQHLSRLSKSGIRCFILDGNHDAEGNISRELRLPQGVVKLSNKKPQTVKLDELRVAIHGQGFDRRDVTENLAANYPDALPGYFNVGMLHTALAGAEDGHAKYAPAKMADLLSKGYQVWALGHVHKRGVLSEDPLVFYPGNTQGRSVRETGPKGCTLVYVQDGVVVSCQHRDLHTARWCVLTINASGVEFPPEIVDSVVERVRGEAGKEGDVVLAARVVITGACPAHREIASDPERWTAEIRSGVSSETGNAWVEKVEFQTSHPLDFSAVRAGQDPLSGLIRHVCDLSATEEVRGFLNEELSVLRDKLPREVFAGEDGFKPEDPQELSRLVEDVKGILINGVLSAGVRR